MSKKRAAVVKTPKASKIEPRKAFWSGRVAKVRGQSNLSPFYEDEKADFYFAAGYDGKTEEEMGLKLVVVGGMAPTFGTSDTATPIEMVNPQ